MGRKITLKENDQVTPCPKCGNNREFTAHSRQCCEDACEVWVVCKCGHDPTAMKVGHRYEDVWGGVHDGNVLVALDVWNDEIAEDVEKCGRPNGLWLA